MGEPPPLQEILLRREDSNSVIGQMHRNLDLAIKAGERIVRVNKSLQRAIHLRDESG